MKFTNERISNADREKYQSMGIDFGFTQYWTINQDRDIFLIKISNYREDPDFPPYQFYKWLFFLRGKIVKFLSRVYLRNDKNYKKNTFSIYIDSFIPEDRKVPDNKKEESLSLLKEALRVHGLFGFPEHTQPTNFIFEF